MAIFKSNNMQDVNYVPRWKTAKTNKDFEKFRKDFDEFCDSDEHDCDDCPYRSPTRSNCYHRYLTEMIVKED